MAIFRQIGTTFAGKFSNSFPKTIEKPPNPIILVRSYFLLFTFLIHFLCSLFTKTQEQRLLWQLLFFSPQQPPNYLHKATALTGTIGWQAVPHTLIEWGLAQ
jgi:hypothetical protein